MKRGEQIEEAVKQGLDPRDRSVIYRIWEDSDVHVSLTRSLTTVKADAAQRAFRARGDGIVWAVLDSGIQGDHPHFKCDDSPFGPIDTLGVRAPVDTWISRPTDGDLSPEDSRARALRDAFGHGTHVAGIIAGYWKAAAPDGRCGRRRRDAQRAGQRTKPLRRVERLRGDQRRGPELQRW